MSVKDSGKGALSPLLLLWRRLGFAVAIGVLAACSSHTPPPSTFATGYVGDRDLVRLWRKDDVQQHSTQLITLSNALRDDNRMPSRNAVETRYQFVQNSVREIQRTYHGAHAESVHVRFAQDGSVSFMQRQLDERRERLSDDEVALLEFDAKRLLELSELLRSGNVRQRVGQLQGNRVLTCEGQNVSPDFDALARERIALERQARPEATLHVAWLEAPEGTQLLLVAAENFCGWKPFASE